MKKIKQGGALPFFKLAKRLNSGGRALKREQCHLNIHEKNHTEHLINLKQDYSQHSYVGGSRAGFLTFGILCVDRKAQNLHLCLNLDVLYYH